MAESLRIAGFFIRVTSDVMPYKWGKLMGNLANAVGAITNAWGDNVAKIVSVSQDEFRKILADAKISWVSQDELSKSWPEVRSPLRGRLDT